MTQRALCFLSLSLVFSAALAEADVSRTPRVGEFRINSYTPGNHGTARVAARPDGGFVVVWASDRESGPDAPGGDPGEGRIGVFARVFNRLGRPTGQDFLVNEYTRGVQFRPAVAVAPSGEFVVVWTGYGDGGFSPSGGSSYGSAYGVFGRLFARDGTPLSGDFQVNTYTTNYQGSASVAMSRSGDFVVVWQSSIGARDTAPQDGSGYGVFGRQFTSWGVPVGDEFQVNAYTPGNQGYPAVAAAANGDFTVVWSSVDGSGFGIFGRRFDAEAQPRGGDFRVNSYTPGHQAFPSIAAAEDGDFVVAWTGFGVRPGQDGSDSGVFGQRFSRRGLRRGPEFRINSYTFGPQGPPCVASGPDADFVVTWMSGAGQDGDRSGVFGQVFDADGRRWGSEFQVNTYTTGFQSRGCPAVLPSGDFVVTWDSTLGYGSGGGIFGRVFDEPKKHH